MMGWLHPAPTMTRGTIWVIHVIRLPAFGAGLVAADAKLAEVTIHRNRWTVPVSRAGVMRTSFSHAVRAAKSRGLGLRDVGCPAGLGGSVLGGDESSVHLTSIPKLKN